MYSFSIASKNIYIYIYIHNDVRDATTWRNKNWKYEGLAESHKDWSITAMWQSLYFII